MANCVKIDRYDGYMVGQDTKYTGCIVSGVSLEECIDNYRKMKPAHIAGLKKFAAERPDDDIMGANTRDEPLKGEIYEVTDSGYHKI